MSAVRPGRRAHVIVVAVVVDLMGVIVVAKRKGSDGSTDNKSRKTAARIAGTVQARNTELFRRLRCLIDGVLFPLVQRPSESALDDNIGRDDARKVGDEAVVIALGDIAAGVI